MIPSPVFSVWISMLSLKDQEVESVLEEDARPELEPNTESEKKKLWNGSEESTMEPFTTEMINLPI